MDTLSQPTETIETYSYKLAWKWKIQLRYVIVLRSKPLTPKYLNLVDLARSLLEPEKQNLESMEATCDYLNRHTNKKWDTDMINILIFCLLESLEVTEMSQVGEASGTMKLILKLMELINLFSVKRNLSTYDLSSIQDAYSIYVRKTRESLSFVGRKLKLLTETQDKYIRAIESDALRISELDTVNEVLQFVITNEVTREDTLSIFDDARISYNLQHVICYSGTRVFQKVYKPGPFDLPVKRAAIISGVNTNPPYGVILFTISLSQVYSMKYIIETGVVQASVRIKDKKPLIQALKDGFPMLDFEVRIVQVETKLSLYPTRELSFIMPYHLILHRTVVQPHVFQFYLDESSSSYPKKNTLVFTCNSFWELPNSDKEKDESTFVLSTPRMANGTNYIGLSITSNSSESTMRALASIIPAICITFSEDVINKSHYYKLYNIPNLVPYTHNPESRLKKELGDKWPEIFTPNYLSAKETSAKSLVKITTDEEEAKRWSEETIMYELTSYKREVRPFPPESEDDDGGTPQEVIFWFTSVHPDTRRLGYRRNDYDDSPKYPLVPFSSIKGEVHKTKGISGGNVVSLAAQGEGLYAEAPDVISHMLGFQARRRGVAFGPNSIIRALLDVANEVGGNEIEVDEEAVSYVRDSLANNYEPELYKQQLFDLSSDEIIRKMEERGDYFDPLIYSAGLEKMFNLDIYYIKARIVHNVRTMTMELPRYSHFYCADARRRKCVVILINNGVRSDRLKWPHCELIVPSDSNSGLYDRVLSSRLAAIREQCHKFLVCCSGTVYNGAYMSSGMNSVLSSFSTVKSQYVDPNGKARAFTVLSDDQLVTIFCYPCAPLSLPHSSQVHPAPDTEWLESLCKNQALGRSELGIWCKHADSREVLYVRSMFIPDSVPTMGIDPLTAHTSGRTNAAKFASNISAKDRLALVLKELILWALDVSGLSWRKFARRYLTYSAEEEDEDTYYNIGSVGIRLPSIENMRDVLLYLESIIPVYDNKIVLHNRAYYLSVKYIISHHPRTQFDSSVSRFIGGYYRSAGDFRSDKNTLILTGLTDPLVTVVDPLSKYTIVDHISLRNIARLPIFYLQEDVLWIIQATHLKEIKVAYKICETWIKKKINSGYNTPPMKGSMKDVLLYKIVAGRLVTLGKFRGTKKTQSESSSHREYYEILQLGIDNYAAMLRASQP